MSLLTTASLVVTPNAGEEGTLFSTIPDTGLGDLSVTRATTATRVNSAGLVELVPYNLLTYSEQFDNADWQKRNNIAITANATTAPNGTLTADKMYLSNNLLADYGIFQILPSKNYTLSVYAKKAEIGYLYLGYNNDTAADGVFYNLNNGTISSNTSSYTASITDEGNGWYRCSVTLPTLAYAFISPSTNGTSFIVTGQLNNGLYIWGAQLNEGTIKDYQKTETRLNIPRLDYSNGTCPSILVEPQRTNLTLYSEQLNNAAYNTGGGAGASVVVSANYGIAPDGNQTADRLQITRGTTYVERYQRRTTTIGQTYTLSFWGKAVTGTPTLYTCYNLGYEGPVTFTNEWVRYTYTFTALYSDSGFNLITWTNLAGTSASADILVWGAQLEAGSYATSYIPTTNASVTRNAEDIKKTGASSLIGQSEGTIFFDGVLLNKQNQYVNIFNTNKDVTNISSWALFWDTTNWRIIFVLFKGNGTFDSSVYLVSSQNFYNTQRLKIAVRYKNGDTTMYINGVQQATSTNSYTINGTKSELFIAEPSVYFGYQDPTECNAAALWKQGLTNAQLATLTTI